MPIADVKHLWNTPAAPHACMAPYETPYQPVLVPGTPDAIWTDWHDVLGAADVKRQDQWKRKATCAERKVAAPQSNSRPTTKTTTYGGPSAYPAGLYEDEDDILGEIARQTSHTRSNDLDIETARWTMRLAHVMDDDAAALLAVRLYLELAPEHTFETWHAHGREELGLTGPEPIFFFGLSQNGWNYPTVFSPATHTPAGHETPASVSSASSPRVPLTPPDGASPAALESALIPAFKNDEFAIEGLSPWPTVEVPGPHAANVFDTFAVAPVTVF